MAGIVQLMPSEVRIVMAKQGAQVALAVGLGGIGTLSLVVGPATWLAEGGSLADAVATADLGSVLFAASRVLHLGAVIAALILEEVPVPITVVGPADLPELLPLVRAYCEFYQVAPSDPALLELSHSLVADPQREGLQLLARDDAGGAVGFATLYWTWQTLAAARVGVMNDLFVAPEARGSGVAEGLIAACLERCREHGATRLVWQTARDNLRAQAVYERVGAIRDDRWLDYELPVQPAWNVSDGAP